MPKRRRALPRGLYRRGEVIYARIQVAGREHRRCLHTRDVETAKRRLVVERERLTAESRYGEHDIRWEAVVVAWTDWIAGRVGRKTATRYAVSLDQIRPWLAGRPITAIDKRLVGEIVAGRQKGRASAATVRRDLTALSSVLTYAEGRDWREGNPALTWLRLTAERRDPIVLPSEADIAAVLEAAGGLAPLIRIARATGARQDELVRANRRDLDAERRSLTLYGKGGRVRTIDVSGCWHLFAALPAGIAAAALIPCPGTGGRWKNVAARFALVTARVERDAKKAGQAFRRFRFHDLRHLHAVEFLRAGGHKDALQERLGHASVATTEWYAKFVAAGTETGTRAISSGAGNDD